VEESLMELKINTVRRLMKFSTSRPVTESAIVLMAQLAEGFIKMTTTEGEKVLDEQNQARKAQGLKEKVRLSDEEIKEAMK
jgi:histone H3/H4